MHIYIDAVEKDSTARSDKNNRTAVIKRSTKQLLAA